MKPKIPAAAAALALGLGAAPALADCTGLTGLALEGASIAEAAEVAASGPVPAHCRVAGTIDGTIGFEVWLPPAAAWNGKFNGVGNGALAGFINTRAMGPALARGYATASGDTGHVGHPVPGAPPFPGFDASWALGADGRRDLAALENFGHRGTHRMTEVAKQIVAAHYGAAPARSYFTGCSGGGQQGLAEAQRYPGDYDGIVSGAPANFPTAMWPGEIYPATLARRIDIAALTAKLPGLAAAAVAACDATDGATDGLIADPRACSFDAATVPGLTPDEAQVVNLIYAGFSHPVTGAQVWPGYEPGSEAEWAGHLNPFFIQLGYLAYMVYEDPAWEFVGFDVTRPADYAAVEAANAILSPLLDATDPDLSAFAGAGGKLIMWHGWTDQNIAPRNSVAYADAVRAAMGPAADDTLRLFMLPGLNHCEGGAGFTVFDPLTALEAWVERGEAPQVLQAATADGRISRGLCAHPARTRYKGGDPVDPASFTCD